MDDDHDNTVVLPETTVAGDALNVTAGSGNTVTVAVFVLHFLLRRCRRV